METNKTLMQPNIITQARFSFTEYEMRILLHVISDLQNRLENNSVEMIKQLWNRQKDYYLDFKLSELLINNEQNQSRLKKALTTLRQKSFEVETDTEWFNVGFLNYSFYDKETKNWQLQISKLMMPYMLSIAKGYTKYQLQVVLNLNNHAQRLYMMMSQWVETGYFIINANKLRHELALENNYKRYKDFKKAVLQRAEDQLKNLYKENRADLYFTLIEDKRKRNIDDDFDRILKFKITVNDQKTTSNEEIKAQWLRDCNEILKETLGDNDNLRKAIFNHVVKTNRLRDYIDRLYRFENETRKKGIPLHGDVKKLMFFTVNDFGYSTK